MPIYVQSPYCVIIIILLCACPDYNYRTYMYIHTCTQLTSSQQWPEVFYCFVGSDGGASWLHQAAYDGVHCNNLSTNRRAVIDKNSLRFCFQDGSLCSQVEYL